MYVSFDCPKPTQELKSRSDIAMRPNQLHSRFHVSQQQKNTNLKKIKEKEIVIGDCRRKNLWKTLKGLVH